MTKYPAPKATDAMIKEAWDELAVFLDEEQSRPLIEKALNRALALQDGQPFNRLTTAEAERLAMLAEEAAEIVQAVGKILRHGYHSHHPDGGPDNRSSLTREIEDLRAVVFGMEQAGDFAPSVNHLDRLEKKLRYTHHQQGFDQDVFVPMRELMGIALTEDEALVLDGLRAAQRLAHKTATDAGWYTDPATGQIIERNFGEVVALMHSELSEALEADRKSLKDDKLPHRDGREVEFADVIIRILDTCAAHGLDVAGALIEKNRINKERADHKIDARRTGGKKY